MATPPQPGKPDPRKQPSGRQLPPGSKSKLPAGKPAAPGQSGSRQPVPRPGSGKGPMQTPPGASGRNRSVVGASVNTDRQTLGLSDVRPSEAIKGLDRVADRYEKAAKGPKRKAGEIDMNVAVVVDQKGKRWARMVLLGVLGTAAVVGLFVWVLVLLGGAEDIDPQAARLETHKQLMRIKRYAYDMDRFGSDENVSHDLFQRKLVDYMKARLEKLEEVVKMETRAGGMPKPDTRDEIKFLKADMALKDAWGRALVFADDDGENITVKSVSDRDLHKSIPIPREQARAGP